MFIKESRRSLNTGKIVIHEIAPGKSRLDGKDEEMSCFLPISALDCFTVVAVVGRGPYELFSPQGKFSVSHGDFWVESLDRVPEFPPKQDLGLQVGQSPLSTCHRYLFLHTCV